MTEMPFGKIHGRVARLREAMGDEGLDVLVLMVVEWNNCESMEYITGFRGSTGAVIVSEDRMVLVTDGRYAIQAKAQSPFELLMRGTASLEQRTCEVLRDGGWSVGGYEAERLTVSQFRALSPAVREWRDCSALLPWLRRTKDAGEIAAIRKAGDIAWRAYRQVLSQAGEGMTERDFNARLECSVRALGAECGWRRGSFLVASGERSALPHGAPTDRAFKKGDLVVVDFGATVDGYMSDLTRTFSVGPRSERAREMESVLLKAHREAVRAMVPGAICYSVDAVARKIITDAGWGPHFVHGLGHSFGLEIHEPPVLGRFSLDSLKAGDVMTVEPGIYIEGWGGMRIEDDYLVTEDGAECLSGCEGQEVAEI